jgi:hypothetical protein
MEAPKLNVTIYDQNPEYNILEVQSQYTNWLICGYNDGDVEISCNQSDAFSNSLVLNQTELKQLISFLQTKVVKTL